MYHLVHPPTQQLVHYLSMTQLTLESSMPLKRNGIYYFRRAVPKNLRTKLHRREIKISLNTRDRLTALQRECECAIKVQLIFERAAAGMEFPKGPLFNYEVRTTTRTEQDGATVTEQNAFIDPKVIEAFKNAGLNPTEISELTKVFFKALESKNTQRNNRHTSETLYSSTLGDYVQKFQHDQEVILKSPLNPRILTQFRRLIQIIDPGQPIASFTIEQAGNVRDVISQLPAKNRKYAHLTVSETIAAAKREDPNYQRLTAKTINDYLDTYRGFFKKAVSDKVYPDHTNPFQDIRVAHRGSEARLEKLRKGSTQHQPFSASELTAIFSTDIHTSYGSQHTHEQFKFWIPLLGLLTGSRMSQLASLYCDDIRESDKIWIIDFNESGDDKVAKTAASLRIVPLHPLLLKLGLPAFAAKVKQAGHRRLFPELSNFHRGTYAKRVEDWFNRKLLIETGVRKDTTTKVKTFHSFRATLLDLLKQAGVEESARNQIIGWTLNQENGNSIARNHYDSANQKVLLKALARIELPIELQQLPPFPIDKPLKFTRPIVNQHSRNKNTIDKLER